MQREGERGKRGEIEERSDEEREREAEHVAPPHSPTFLGKSSQTAAIGERHG